jgi:hypothetical protein
MDIKASSRLFGCQTWGPSAGVRVQAKDLTSNQKQDKESERSLGSAVDRGGGFRPVH